MKLLQDKAPELSEEFGNYLDCVAELRKNDQEGLYLLGVRDGIQLLRHIMTAN